MQGRHTFTYIVSTLLDSHFFFTAHFHNKQHHGHQHRSSCYRRCRRRQVSPLLYILPVVCLFNITNVGVGPTRSPLPPFFSILLSIH